MVFITAMEYVYSAVQAEPLYIIQASLASKQSVPYSRLEKTVYVVNILLPSNIYLSI